MFDTPMFRYPIPFERYSALWSKGTTNLDMIVLEERYLLFRTWKDGSTTVQIAEGRHVRLPNPQEVADWYCIRIV